MKGYLQSIGFLLFIALIYMIGTTDLYISIVFTIAMIVGVIAGIGMLIAITIYLVQYFIKAVEK